MLERENLELMDGSTEAHQLLVKKALLWIGENLGWVCWSNTSGKVKTDTGRYIKFGLKGTSDIIGFNSDGKFVAIEVKTGNSKLTKAQKAFQMVCKKNNVKHYVVRPGMPFKVLFNEN